MRLHVVFDSHGDILAAAELGSSPIRARPIADQAAGHRSMDIDLPVEFQHYNLGTVCHRLRIDVAGKFPEVKAKS
jgi:hypothetical protein